MNVVDNVEENVDETEAKGDPTDAAASWSIQENEAASLDPKVKADLKCLGRIGCVIDTEKKQSSASSILVKAENVLA